MSSNAALSAARRRRSNPVNAPTGTMGGPGGPPANRILQRMSGAPPSHPQQQQQHPQARMATPQMQQQQRGPLQQQQQQQQQQQMKRTQQQMQQQKPQSQIHSSLNALPPLPPPNKNAGQLYGIPLHPLIMFQTHDNKLNEHDLSITECFDQLKEFEGRLIVVEGNGGGVHPLAATATAAAAPAGAASDLNELMNDGVFINGVVDNIMATTNFASIVENIIPLKEENEMLKQRISEQEIRSEQMYQFIQQLEERLRNIENELAQPCEEVSAQATTALEAEAVEDAPKFPSKKVATEFAVDGSGETETTAETATMVETDGIVTESVS